VKVLAFRVAECHSNCHTATLIDDYLAWGESDEDSWTRDAGGVAVVKLRAP
jgi:hypothetical protein